MLTHRILADEKAVLVLILLFVNSKKAFTEDSWSSLNDCFKNFPTFFVFTEGHKSFSVPALKHEFKHAAAIGWREIGNEIRWACGGSLVSKDTILTAAHCTLNREGNPPNVVRLGDLNLETDDDDKETQQYEIAKIIRHPDYSTKTRYHDVALIKLETPVNITNFVTPACLWPFADINKYNELEACGFGQTEYGGPISPVLNKIVISPIGKDECAEHYGEDRKLPNGIDDSHLCAFDKTGGRMDSCEGDSGGPLELKLRLIEFIVPYVVGVTAFGKGCGFYSPGVYTRVSSHLDWIKSQENIFTDPLECAQKYKILRYEDPNDYSYKNEPQKIILGEKEGEECPGVILTNSYLAASATCLHQMFKPNRVPISYPEPHQIQEIIFHPQFDINFPEKTDIALVRLSTRIIWSQSSFPTCVTGQNIPDHKTTVEYNVFAENSQRKFKSTKLSNISYCLDYYGMKSLSEYDDSVLCFDSGRRHVPNSCEIPKGSAITKITGTVSKPSITQGLSIHSKDCGPIFATNLAKYVEWMDSVIFRPPDEIVKTNEQITSVFFLDTDLVLNDSCVVPGSNITGHCSRPEECSKSRDGTSLICGSSGSLICCPTA